MLNTDNASDAESTSQFVSAQIEMLQSGMPERLKLNTTTSLERWCNQRISYYSSAKETFVLAVTLLIGFVGGPALIFFCMNWLLAGSLGTSGGSAEALAFNGFLYLILLTLASILGWISLKSLCTPTHLAISNSGINYEYHTFCGHFKGALLDWHDIGRMEIFKPKGSINPEKYSLRFRYQINKKLDMPLRWLGGAPVKEKFSAAISEYLPEVERDLEVAFYLQAPSEHSFTELWFQSLEPLAKPLDIRSNDTGN